MWRRWNFLLLSLAAIAVVVPTVALGVVASAAATTSSVLTAAKAAIAKQTGVHLVVTTKSSSSASTEKWVADLGAKSGVETIAEGKASASIKVTPTYAYFTGNSAGLTTIFGLSAAEAKKIGKDWVSLKSSTSQYSDLKSGVTISSVTGVLPKAKGTSLSTTVTAGVHLYVLKWTTAATSSTPKLSITLTISATGATLPVEETTAASGGAEEALVFSKWGERVAVSTPPAASTISYSKVTS